MKYFSKIKIKKELKEEMQQLLNKSSVNLHNMGYGEDCTIKTFTAKFENGFQADISVCSGINDFFIDPVLFDQNNCQCCTLDVCEELLGKYEFEDKDNEYIVQIELEEEHVLL